ncbi:hypothetical protein ACIBKY_05030 [Nonomuraea sp. NPDC050394]|uniref:hypothetical protein n=1 Tax=Nonomuraea sp. NPDC050394 TaxID=3364363 RepID=UPI0037B92E89
MNLHWKSILGAAAVVAAAVTIPATGAQAAGCGVNGKGVLWCGNEGNAPLYDKPSTTTPVGYLIDNLWTTNSWFTCWSEGQYHKGGNTTWYKTQGDRKGKWGWVPAGYVFTSDGFDANPSRHGLPKCQYDWD